jgi:hypothetical protein
MFISGILEEVTDYIHYQVVQKLGREFEHCNGIHPFILALGISMHDNVIFCFRYVVLSLSEGDAA